MSFPIPEFPGMKNPHGNGIPSMHWPVSDRMSNADNVISGIDIGYWFHYRAKYWLLGAYSGIVLTLPKDI